MSFAYLNNIQEIEEEINKLNKTIRNLQDQIRKYMESNDILDIKKENPIYKLCMIRNLGKASLKTLIKKIIEHDTNKKLNLEDLSSTHDLIAVIPTTIGNNDEKETITHKVSKCDGCSETFAKGHQLTKHLKENPDCKILHELEKITMKKCEVCNTWWKNENELNKHINFSAI